MIIFIIDIDDDGDGFGVEGANQEGREGGVKGPGKGGSVKHEVIVDDLNGKL